MARIVVIHNDQDATSRLLLSALQSAYGAEVEVLPFMVWRQQLWFRGCPAVWLLPAGSTGYADSVVAWKGEVTVAKADVDNALPLCRVIALSADTTTINHTGGAAPTTANITAILTNLDGAAEAMDGVSYTAAGQIVQATDGSLAFSSATPGTFTIRCQHPYAADTTIQVVVQ